MINIHEIERGTLKSILAEILQDQGPRSRMEIFARQAGYRTDATMTAAASSINPSGDENARAAAHGYVLPHMVMSAMPMVEETSNRRASARPCSPRADAILKAASSNLDDEMFKEHLGDVLSAARVAPEGAPRWFFAVATADALFKPDPRSDKFWLTKAATTLCGILALAGRIPEGTGIHEGLVAELASLSEDNLSPWELHGHRLLKNLLPPKTQQSIFSTMVDALPHAAWSRADSASGRALRPGIMSTESWQAL
jgi:hypothetical protein